VFLSGVMVQPDFAELITKSVCVLHKFVKRESYNFEDMFSCEMEDIHVCSIGSITDDRH
jgi:hypothetical protein